MLERDRELRYQTMSDFRAELRRLQRDADSSLTFPSARRTTGETPKIETASASSGRNWQMPALLAPALWAVIALLLIAAGWVAGKWFNGSNNQAVKNTSFLQLTYQGGEEAYPSLSPDAKQLAYTSRAEGNSEI